MRRILQLLVTFSVFFFVIISSLNVAADPDQNREKQGIISCQDKMSAKNTEWKKLESMTYQVFEKETTFSQLNAIIEGLNIESEDLGKVQSDLVDQTLNILLKDKRLTGFNEDFLLALSRSFVESIAFQSPIHSKLSIETSEQNALLLIARAIISVSSQSIASYRYGSGNGVMPKHFLAIPTQILKMEILEDQNFLVQHQYMNEL